MVSLLSPIKAPVHTGAFNFYNALSCKVEAVCIILNLEATLSLD